VIILLDYSGNKLTGRIGHVTVLIKKISFLDMNSRGEIEFTVQRMLRKLNNIGTLCWAII